MYGYLDITSEIELLIIVWGLIPTDLFGPKVVILSNIIFDTDCLRFADHINTDFSRAIFNIYALVFNSLFYFSYFWVSKRPMW